MKKILSLFVVLIGSISLQSATITKVGDTFGAAGFASEGQQTVAFTYEVTKLPSGSTPGECKLSSVDTKGYVYQNLFVPSSFQHTYSGSSKVFRLTEVGNNVFQSSKHVNVVFAYPYGELPSYIKLDRYAFAVSESLLSLRWCIGTKNFNSISSMDFVKFGDLEECALLNCHKLNMPIQCGEVLKNGGANVTHKIGENAVANCYAVQMLTCGGSDIAENAFKGSDGILVLSWLGGSSSITSETKSPFYPLKDKLYGIVVYGSVPDYYFRNFSALYSVVMPEDIWSYASVNTSIGRYAFSGCKGLGYVAIGGKVDGNAFYDSPNISTVYWRGGDPGITASNMSIFRSSASKLTTFKFESTSGGCSVPDYICAGLKALKSVSIPANTGGKIGKSAFNECTALESVDFSGDFSSYYVEIAPYAFYKCSALTKITNNNTNGFPKSTYKIGEYAFASCYALTTGLSSANTNIIEIGTHAFYSTGITNLVIPASTWTLKLGREIAGGYQSKLTSISYYYSKSLSRANAGGSYANVFLSAESSGSSYRGKITTIDLSTSVTEIPDSLFYSFKGVEVVNWAAGVEKYGNHAFHDCTKLKYITLGNAVTFGESAFENADMSGSAPTNLSKLTSIGPKAFKNTLITEAGSKCSALTKIEANAFENCKKLATVTIPENVTTIYSDVFKGCTLLKTINWNAKSYAYAGPFDETIGKQITKITLGDEVSLVPRQLLTGSSLKLLEFPTSVKTIGANAFKNCTMDSVAFVCYNAETQSSSVSKAEDGPFAGSSIKALYMPASVKTVPKYMFANTAGIDRFSYKGLETFDQYSFAGSGVKEMTFNNIKHINANSFANCSSLATINLYGTVCTPSSTAFSGTNNVKKIVTTCANYNEVYNNATWKAVCSNIENFDSKFTQEYLDKLLGRDVMGTDFWSTNCQIEITSELTCEGKVTLKAIPFDGATFQYWMIDGSTENPRTFDLNEYSFWFIGALGAYPSDFHQQYFAMVPEEAGNIDARNEFGHDRSDLRYLNNEQAVLKANITNEWYEFKEWQWSSGVSEQPMVDWEDPTKCSFSVRYMPGGDMGGEMGMEPIEQPEHDENVKAVCQLRAINVTVEYSSNPGGTVQIEGVNHKLGEEITLTATPNEGFVFKQWSNNSKNATTKVTIDLKDLIKRTLMGTDPETGEPMVYDEKIWDGYSLQPYDPSAEYIYQISAVFEADPNYKKTYTITVSSLDPAKGSVTGGGEYEEGTVATLVATPEDGYQFTVWSDGVTDNPRAVTVTGNATFTAIFTDKIIEHPTYIITATSEDPAKGIVTGGGEYEEGTTVTLTATPAEGYEFVKWSDDNTDNPRTITVIGHATYTALFHLIGEGIDQVQSVPFPCNKVLIDGLLYIERNGVLYDVNGKKVK